MYAAVLAVEAARTAQEIHGTSAINAAQMRDGMEALEITEEKMAGLGLADFGPSFKVSCENHGGPGHAAIQQWDAAAKKWNLITDFTPSDMEVIGALIEEDSAAYAKENNITPRDCS